MKKIALVLSFVLGASILAAPISANACSSGYYAGGAYALALALGIPPTVLKSISGMPAEQREVAWLSAKSQSSGLNKQAASGFHQSWKSMSAAEKKALKKDASLGQMAGF
jgi:hypothetical protein